MAMTLNVGPRGVGTTSLSQVGSGQADGGGPGLARRGGGAGAGGWLQTIADTVSAPFKGLPGGVGKYMPYLLAAGVVFLLIRSKKRRRGKIRRGR